MVIEFSFVSHSVVRLGLSVQFVMLCIQCFFFGVQIARVKLDVQAFLSWNCFSLQFNFPDGKVLGLSFFEVSIVPLVFSTAELIGKITNRVSF